MGVRRDEVAKTKGLPNLEQIIKRMWKLANAGAGDAVKLACFPPEEWRGTEKLELDGNACFDFIILPSGRPLLLECNPRISATIPFIAKAGADLVYLRCKQLLGEPIDTNVSFDYGLKMVKYYDAHYYR